jgi:hypothetical protein
MPIDEPVQLAKEIARFATRLDQEELPKGVAGLRSNCGMHEGCLEEHRDNSASKTPL